jgi:phage host-nuclease inhibitor protein Gam
MATKREKKVIQSGITTEQYEEAMSGYAVADARMQGILASIDMKIANIREKYAEEISQLQDTKEKHFETLEVFAKEQRDTLFVKKKSIENVHGFIGFRTGTPKLKTLKGFTWNAVTNLLTEFLPSYIRTTQEAAKDRILADREIPEVAENLRKVGLTVTQEESFFVELKKESGNGDV